MLRSLFLVPAAALVLAACGDSDDPAPAPEPQLSGTVLGQPFTPVEGIAVPLGSATCDLAPDLGTLEANTTGLLIGFGSFAGLCQLVTSTQGCGVKANATTLVAVVARASLTGTAAPIQPGTYSVFAGTPLPDAQGSFSGVQAVVSRTDATCGDPSGNPIATGGTVRIDAIDASRVTGFADLTFEGTGGRVSGAFSVPRCAFQTDVCTVLSGGDCTGDVCVP